MADEESARQDRLAAEEYARQERLQKPDLEQKRLDAKERARKVFNFMQKELKEKRNSTPQ